MVRDKKGILRFKWKNIDSAHFLRIRSTLCQSTTGDIKVVHGDYIDQDVRLFQKFRSLIVEYLLGTLHDNIKS